MSLETLIDAERRGTKLKYLHFWGHQPNADGSVGKGCLSQWWPASFRVDGVHYASAEHFMMAEKARLFADGRTHQQILAASTPGHAKRLGRQVRGFDTDVWDAARFDIVVQASLMKFGQNAALRDYLLATRHRVLVEASPPDRIWGIGLAADDPRALSPSKWRGLNLLGFALMHARARLGA